MEAFYRALHQMWRERDGRSQSPSAAIPWNKPLVYWHYQQTEGWTREEVDQQVLERFGGPDVQSTRHDRDSIMQYPVDNMLTLRDYEIGWNDRLSEQDKTFIGELYPR